MHPFKSKRVETEKNCLFLSYRSLALSNDQSITRSNQTIYSYARSICQT